MVFVTGLHKSGTSLLHRSIKRHPEISGMSDTTSPKDEGQHLQEVYPPAAKYGGPGLFGLRSPSYRTEKSALVTHANRQRLLSAWGRHWDDKKSVVVEKSPPHLTQTRFLQALFPNSFFIVIRRHPVANALATRKIANLFMPLIYRCRDTGVSRLLLTKLGPLRKPPVPLVLENWLRCYERYDDDRKYLDRQMVVSFERFVTSPDETLSEIFRFVGLEPFPFTEEMRQGVNEGYFETWRRLTPCYRNWMIRRFSARASRLGYEIENV